MTKQTKPIDKFIEKYTDIQGMVNRLQSLCDSHFNKSPEDIKWTDVNEIHDIAKQLEYTLFMAGDLKPEEAKYNESF